MTKPKTPARRSKLDHKKSVVWELRLYVAGQTAKSIHAFANLKVLCEDRLKDRYRIEVIDLLKNPQLARGHQIVAIPTLVRRLPKPMREMIGVLFNTVRVLVGLDLRGAGLTQLSDFLMTMPMKKKSGPAGKRKPVVPADPEASGSQGYRARYELRLYVSGSTLKSARAVENIKRVCEEHLKDRYHLEVVDVYQQPDLARGDQVVAVPTLIKRLPLPLRRLIGDLSNEEKVLLGLDLSNRNQ